jgi:hypothetical protein
VFGSVLQVEPQQLLCVVVGLCNSLQLVAEPIAACNHLVVELVAIAKAEVLVCTLGAASEHDVRAHNTTWQEVLVLDNEAEHPVATEQGGIKCAAR